MDGLAMAEGRDDEREREGADAIELAVTVDPARWDWFVLVTPPRKEAAVKRQLRRDGHSVLLPMTLKWGRWGRHDKAAEPMEMPLMPRYLFLAAAKDTQVAWRPILELETETAAGLLRLAVLGMNGRPSRLDPACIVPLMRHDRFRAPESAKVIPFKAGDSVEIEGGPFDMMAGTIETILSAKARARLLFEGGLPGIEVPLEILRLRA